MSRVNARCFGRGKQSEAQIADSGIATPTSLPPSWSRTARTTGEDGNPQFAVAVWCVGMLAPDPPQSLPDQVPPQKRGQDRLLCPQAPDHPGQEQVQCAQVPPGRPLHQPRHHHPDRLVRDQRRQDLRRRLLARAPRLRHRARPDQLGRCLRHGPAPRPPRAHQARH